MNAAFLIMSSAALAGADPTPPPPPPAVPVVVSGAGCNNCGTPAPCCGSSKPGLFDRFKSRMGGFGKKSHDCGCAPAPTCCTPAPTCCTPAPTCCAPAPTCCSNSIANRPNLFDNLKSRWGSKKHATPCCDPCGAGTVMTALPPPPPPGTGMGTTPPKEMPKPKDDKPKGGNTSSTPVPLPAVPTVNGASGSSPY